MPLTMLLPLPRCFSMLSLVVGGLMASISARTAARIPGPESNGPGP
jgi:hypothetical protein